MKEDIKTKIKNQIDKYEINYFFKNNNEFEEWISSLSELQINNFLNLNINFCDITFDTALLINKDLLSTDDYINRVSAIASIRNAIGCYHLFENLVDPVFLNSKNFYQDIEVLKKAGSARPILWIINKPCFINSPYHSEDLNILVSHTSKNENKDRNLSSTISKIAENYDSIISPYHQQDIQTVIKYGATHLQYPCTFPKSTITYLATNSNSLNSPTHLEDMILLAENMEIGSFLYAVMTNKNAIDNPSYKEIIKEMIEHKKNIKYVILLCCYTIGLEETKKARTTNSYTAFYEISTIDNINDIFKQVNQKLNSKDKNIKMFIENKSENNSNKIKQKKLFINVFKKNK